MLFIAYNNCNLPCCALRRYLAAHGMHRGQNGPTLGGPLHAASSPSLQQLGLLHSCMHDVRCMQWQPLALPEATNCHMLRVDRAPIWWWHAKKCMHAGCTLTQPINKKPNHMH